MQSRANPIDGIYKSTQADLDGSQTTATAGSLHNCRVHYTDDNYYDDNSNRFTACFPTIEWIGGSPMLSNNPIPWVDGSASADGAINGVVYTSA